MLTLDIAVGDLADPWRPEQVCSASGWSTGRSFVRPVDRPGLVTDQWSVGRRTVLLVGSSGGEHRRVRSAPGPSLDDLVAELTDPRADQLLVDLDGEARTVRIGTGSGGTAPIYLLALPGRLVGHWDLTQLYPYLSATDLDPLLAAHYLARSRPYSRRTLLRPVHHLTERASAVWQGGERLGRAALEVHYPRPAADVAPREIRPGADPVQAFGQGLSAVIASRMDGGPDPWAAEVSGGADSAATVLAARAALQRDGRPAAGTLLTFGVAVPGPASTAQQRRRRELVRLTSAQDVEVAGQDHPPLGPHGYRLTGPFPFGPHEEIYTEAFDALLVTAQRSGVRRVLTGTGGDELFLPHLSELSAGDRADLTPVLPPELPAYLSRHAVESFWDSRFTVDHAPRTLVPRSTLTAGASRAALFLRRGIVPVSPLADPLAVDFVRSLPASWRQHKRLARDYLHRRGCSPLTVQPVVPESFHVLFDQALRGTARPLLHDLFSAPRLADLGLVDADRLRQSYRSFVDRGPTPDGRATATERFYEVAALELMLRDLGG